jgi:Cys-rich repeat protein
MEKTASGYKATLVSLGICVLCLGLVLLGTACPPPTPACTSDADCAAGEVCNVATGVCEAAPTGCTSDADCEEGEVCNVDTGECEAAPTGCTSDADCEEGEVCNVDTGECEAAPAGCTSDADCEEGYFCDLDTGECVENVNLYANVAFDHDLHQGAFDCGLCHHDGAGFSTCDTCHDRDEVVDGVVVLKDAMHNPDTGCRQCHEAAFTDSCRTCHIDLPE